MLCLKFRFSILFIREIGVRLCADAQWFVEVPSRSRQKQVWFIRATCLPHVRDGTLTTNFFLSFCTVNGLLYFCPYENG